MLFCNHLSKRAHPMVSIYQLLRAYMVKTEDNFHLLPETWNPNISKPEIFASTMNKLHTCYKVFTNKYCWVMWLWAWKLLLGEIYRIPMASPCNKHHLLLAISQLRVINSMDSCAAERLNWWPAFVAYRFPLFSWEFWFLCLELKRSQYVADRWDMDWQPQRASPQHGPYWTGQTTVSTSRIFHPGICECMLMIVTYDRSPRIQEMGSKRAASGPIHQQHHHEETVPKCKRSNQRVEFDIGLTDEESRPSDALLGPQQKASEGSPPTYEEAMAESTVPQAAPTFKNRRLAPVLVKIQRFQS